MEVRVRTQRWNEQQNGLWQWRGNAKYTAVAFGHRQSEHFMRWLCRFVCCGVSVEASFILMLPSELSHAKLHWLLTLIKAARAYSHNVFYSVVLYIFYIPFCSSVLYLNTMLNTSILALSLWWTCWYTEPQCRLLCCIPLYTEPD